MNLVLKADVQDKQRSLQALKYERTKDEQAVWDAEDTLKRSKQEHFQIEGRLNETRHVHEMRLQELTNNNKEVDRQEIKLEKLNKALDDMQREEKGLEQQLDCQK